MNLEDDIGGRREAFVSVRLPPRTIPLASDVKVYSMTLTGQKRFTDKVPFSEMVDGVDYVLKDIITFRYTPLEMQYAFEGRDADGKYNPRIEARATYQKRNAHPHKRESISDSVRVIMLKADGYSIREIAIQIDSSEKYVRNVLNK